MLLKSEKSSLKTLPEALLLFPGCGP